MQLILAVLTVLTISGQLFYASLNAGVLPHRVKGIQITPAGSIYAVGAHGGKASQQDFMILRLLSDGSSDLRWGSSEGRITLAAPSFENRFQKEDTLMGEMQQVLVDPAGNVTVAGTLQYFQHTVNGYSRKKLVARFLPEGGLDTRFGQNGVWFSDPDDSYSGLKGIAMDRENRVLLRDGNDGLLRLTADGKIDSRFGENGFLSLKFSRSFYFQSFAVDSQGKILAVGTKEAGRFTPLVLRRYLPDGRLDTSFGESGEKVTPLLCSTYTEESGGGERDDAQVIQIGGAGDIFAAGFCETTDPDYKKKLEPFLACYDPRGTSYKILHRGPAVTLTDYSNWPDWRTHWWTSQQENGTRFLLGGFFDPPDFSKVPFEVQLFDLPDNCRGVLSPQKIVLSQPPRSMPFTPPERWISEKPLANQVGFDPEENLIIAGTYGPGEDTFDKAPFSVDRYDRKGQLLSSLEVIKPDHGLKRGVQIASIMLLMRPFRDF